jgi:choline-glycine betaine transporter
VVSVPLLIIGIMMGYSLMKMLQTDAQTDEYKEPQKDVGSP